MCISSWVAWLARRRSAATLTSSCRSRGRRGRNAREPPSAVGLIPGQQHALQPVLDGGGSRAPASARSSAISPANGFRALRRPSPC